MVSDPEALYFGGRVEEHSLVPLGEARLGRIGLDEWFRAHRQRPDPASALAYFDVFWLLAAVMVVLVPVVLLMKRSVAEKGARVGVE